jgi:D-amino-acid dehydrogenase
MAGMTERVLVIGGRIVGSSAAYRLACRGVRVTLIDRADQGQATAAGAGIVSPATSFSAPPARNALAYRAAAYYPELVASLRDDGITGTGYAIPGGLVVASGDAEDAQLNGAFRILVERAQARAPDIGELTRLDDTAARALFLPLARDQRDPPQAPGA